DIGDRGALLDGFRQVQENARRATPGAELRGVLVQEMVGPGTELIAGMKHDQQFGAVLACGLGGTLVEVLRDVQLLLPPVEPAEVRSALERLRGYPILVGARGARPGDVD